MSALTTLGNNSGFIYAVDKDGTSIIENLANNLNNVKKILLDASTSVGLSGNAGAYDSNYGRRYWLDAAGIAGVLSGAEITGFIVNRGMNSTIPVTSYTIATGVVTPIRKACLTIVNIEGEGGASDQLDTITTTDYNTGDLIIFQGATTGHVITFKDSTGNIKTANAADFLTGNLTKKIILEYNAGDTNWYEVSRTPNPLLTVANMRAAGIPTPISGVNKTTLTNGGGTINIEPGVDKGIQVYDGSPTLAGSYVIQIQAAPGTPYLDGDTMFVEYRALTTVGANTVTIFGIQLTTTQALQGRVYLKAEYKLSNTTWYYDVFYDCHGVDVTNKAYVDATFEPALGNPAGNGYILSSDTLGVRSWIPNAAAAGNLWEVGAGAGAIQTSGNGADASGVASFAAGIGAIASNDGAIAIGGFGGLFPTASGVGSIAIGLQSTASADDTVAVGDVAVASGAGATAVGNSANASGVDSLALGEGVAVGAGSNAIGKTAKSNIDKTTNISGPQITRKASSVSDSDFFLHGAAAVVSLTTEEMDLKSTADFTITIPTGAKFYPNGVDLIITTLGGTFTGQPTIKSGITGTLDKFVSAVPTVGLAAIYDRQSFTVAYRSGVSTLTFSITNAATGSSTIKGRAVFSGILVESE